MNYRNVEIREINNPAATRIHYEMWLPGGGAIIQAAFTVGEAKAAIDAHWAREAIDASLAQEDVPFNVDLAAALAKKAR